MDEIISLAFEEGPQVIDYGQGVAAVILTLDEYQRIAGETIDLSQKKAESPFMLLRKKRGEADPKSILGQVDVPSEPDGSIWKNNQLENQTTDPGNSSKDNKPNKGNTELLTEEIGFRDDFVASMEVIDSQPSDKEPTQRPGPGLYEGMIEIKPNFDDPLDEVDTPS